MWNSSLPHMKPALTILNSPARPQVMSLNNLLLYKEKKKHFLASESSDTNTLFFYFSIVLFTERACPQLAKANLGGPCLNRQITKKYTDKN